MSRTSERKASMRPGRSSPQNGSENVPTSTRLGGVMAPARSDLVVCPAPETIEAHLRQADPSIYPEIRNFLLGSVALYPGIVEWWDGKIVPGLKSGRRISYVAMVEGQVAALSIGKRSTTSAKLCTLRVSPALQGHGVGRALLGLTLAELLSARPRHVHYTISEEMLGVCGSFFESFGFTLATWSNGRYVRGADELVFTTTARRLAKRLQEERGHLRLAPLTSRVLPVLRQEKRTLCQPGC